MEENREDISYDVVDVGDEFIAHHGVKGQKWGVRRTAAQLGHKIKSGSEKFRNTPESNHVYGMNWGPNPRKSYKNFVSNTEDKINRSKAGRDFNKIKERLKVKTYTNSMIPGTTNLTNPMAFEFKSKKKGGNISERDMKIATKYFDKYNSVFRKETDKYEKAAWRRVDKKLNKTEEGRAFNKMLRKNGYTQSKPDSHGRQSITKTKLHGNRNSSLTSEDAKIVNNYFKKKFELISKESETNNTFYKIQREKQLHREWVESHPEMYGESVYHRESDDSDSIMHSIDVGNDFLMHYGVKGMKWDKHKKISDPVYETRDAVVKTAINSGLKGATKTAINKTRSESTKKISSSVSKGMGAPSNVAKRVGRNAVVRGLSKNPKARANYLKAERTRINHRQAKASLRLAKGYAKVNKFFKIKPNAKNKKAANKNWRKNRDMFYESL